MDAVDIAPANAHVAQALLHVHGSAGRLALGHLQEGVELGAALGDDRHRC